MSARKPGHCFTFYAGPISRKNIASLAELELWFWKPTVPLQPTLKIEKMVLGQGYPNFFGREPKQANKVNENRKDK